MPAFQEIGVQAVAKGVGKFNSDVQRMESQTKSFGTAASTHLGGIVAAFGGVAAAFGSFRAFESVIGSTQELGLSVEKLRRETGLTTEDASRLLFAFKHVGLGADDASRTLGIFAKKLKGIQDEETGVTSGGKSTAEILKDIGVNATDAAGHILPINEILAPLADRFASMPDGIDKTGLALQLFGRGGKDIIPLLNLGSKGLAELSAEADKLGVTLSGENVAAIKKFTFAQRDMKEAIGGLKLQIGLALLPVLTRMIKAFTEAQPAMRRFLVELIQGVKDSRILQDLIRDVQLLLKVFGLIVSVGHEVVTLFGHLADSILHFRLGGINDDFADFARLLGLGETGARIFGTIAEKAFSIVGNAASLLARALSGLLDTLGPVGTIIRNILGPIGDFISHLSAGALAAQAVAGAVGLFIASLVISKVLSMTGAVLGLAQEMANLLVQVAGLAGKVFTFTIARVFTGGAEAAAGGAGVTAAEAGAAAGQQLQHVALATVDEMHVLNMTVDSVTQTQLKPPSEAEARKLGTQASEAIGKGLTQGLGAGIGFEAASEALKDLIKTPAVGLGTLAATVFVAAFVAEFVLATQVFGHSIQKALTEMVAGGLAGMVLQSATPVGLAVGALEGILVSEFAGDAKRIAGNIATTLGDTIGSALAAFFTPSNLGRVVGTGLAVLVAILFPPTLAIKFRKQIGVALNAIGEGILTFFSKDLPVLISSLDLGGIASAIGTGLSVAFSVAFTAVTQDLPHLISQIPRLFAGLIINIPAALKALPGAIVSVFTNLPGLILSTLTQLVPQLISFFANLPITQVVGEFLKGVEESFLGFFNINLGDVGGWISTLAGLLAGLPAIAVGALVSLGSLLLGVITGALTGLGSALLSAAEGALSAVGGALASFFTPSNLGKLAGTGFAALVAIVFPPTLLVKFRSQIIGLAGPIASALTSLFSTIAKKLPGLASSLLVLVGKALGAAFKELPKLFSAAFSVLADVLPDLGNLGIKLLEALVQVLAGVFQALPGLLSSGLGAAFDAVTQDLPSLVAGIPAAFISLLTDIPAALTGLGEALLTALTDALSGISLSDIINTFLVIPFVGFPTIVLGALATFAPQVLDFFVGLGKTVLGAIGDFLGSFEKAFLGFFNINAGDVNHWISDTVGFVVGLGGQLLETIGGFLGDVVTIFAGLAGRVLGALGDLSGVLVGAGFQLMGGLRNAIEIAVGAPGGLLTRIIELGGIIANAIVDAFTGAFKGAWNTFADVVNGILSRGIHVPSVSLPVVGEVFPGGDIDLDSPIPHLAKGTRRFKGGLAVLGELGKELVALPRGAQVLDAKHTERLLAALAHPAPQMVQQFAPPLPRSVIAALAQPATRGDFTANITVDTQKEAAREIERTLRRVAFSVGN